MITKETKEKIKKEIDKIKDGFILVYNIKTETADFVVANVSINQYIYTTEDVKRQFATALKLKIKEEQEMVSNANTR